LSFQFLSTSTIFLSMNLMSNQWVPRGSPCLGHVAPNNLQRMCHLSTSDWIFHLPSQPMLPMCYHVTYATATCHLQRVPRHLLTIDFFFLLFSCLGKRSECDNFCIRCPFEEVNICGINATRRLQWNWFHPIMRTFIFEPFLALSGSWIRFWITYHE
jgi:hypothetical protein